MFRRRDTESDAVSDYLSTPTPANAPAGCGAPLASFRIRYPCQRRKRMPRFPFLLCTTRRFLHLLPSHDHIFVL